jgi:hypothetical protein
LTNFQALFEIKYVNQQHFFYAFGNQNFYGFELVCERFRYSNETVDTGIIEIDDAASTTGFAYDFNMVAGNHGSYDANETVYQGASLATATSTAVVISWDKPSLVLKLRDIKGVFLPDQVIVGDLSAAAYTLDNVDMLNNSNDGLDNNSEFGDLADSILDFSEHNPFGEP